MSCRTSRGWPPVGRPSRLTWSLGSGSGCRTRGCTTSTGCPRRTPPAASPPTTTCANGRAASAGRWTAWRRRCAGDDGAVLGPDEPGALWLRGSLVTTGYAFDEEATRAAIRDGWFDTGDIARRDREGYVTILDRTKDMINRGGTKIFSAEVEELLRRHPAVDDAAVVGVPDALAGEAVAAFVVAAAPVTAAEVRAWVREGMADHAAPKVVEMLDALPRNAVGKTDKQALRARLR